ncbi:hypothetical protein FN976_05875 [Caenimonas sedimenti]|uniref:Uncharacterized protein n=1 Tax=Caenimonas sedimenti TaxID=2596921 RepID=A0A562ZUF7_9BURK|nr:hypothetical protein [Caenimonas sedimenti]TWO72232.1 hypothetical protein FN976_05875 [Caenimonas sedimenti]
MSEATDKLARSRLAIVDHIHRRERRHDPRETPAPPGFGLGGDAEPPDPPDPGSGWLGHMKHAVKTWWRYHPAHMAVDIATPMLQAYAQRKPVQLLAISAAAGAVLTFARPWKLISLTTIAVAVLKSSQLSGLLMAAMSAADYRKDNDRPG